MFLTITLDVSEYLDNVSILCCVVFGNSCAVMELWISVNNPEPITLQTWRPVNIIAHETRRTMPTLALIALALLASHEVRLEWSPLELSTKHREIYKARSGEGPY